MAEQTIAVLRQTLSVLQRRRWAPFFSSGPGSPLNIRSAVSAAADDLCPHPADWYREYLAAVNVLTRSLGCGIHDWEGKRDRTQSQAEQVVTNAIALAERSEAGRRAQAKQAQS